MLTSVMIAREDGSLTAVPRKGKMEPGCYEEIGSTPASVRFIFLELYTERSVIIRNRLV